MSQQVQSWMSVAKHVAPSIMTAALAVGTGGVSSFEYLSLRGASGYRLQVLINENLSSSSNYIKSSLETVRSALGISVWDTARMFKVTRQTFYDWSNGSRPSQDKLARLNALLDALAAHRKVLHGVAPKLGLRKLPQGLTFVETIANGMDPADAVSVLASTLASENVKRQKLMDRIHKKPRSGLGSNEFEVIG